MTSPLRIEYDGVVYHITSRGKARKPIYKENADRRIVSRRSKIIE